MDWSGVLTVCWTVTDVLRYGPGCGEPYSAKRESIIVYVLTTLVNTTTVTLRQVTLT